MDNFFLELEDGKYIIKFVNGELTALRHGQPWRDLIGDKLVLAMAQEIRRLRGLQELPRVNIRCETEHNGILGSTSLDVIRVEREDDGSITAVTNHWPS